MTSTKKFFYVLALSGICGYVHAVDTDKDGIPDPIDPYPAVLETYAWLASFTGLDTTSGYGRVVAGVGDVNNDGYADVAEGIPFYDEPVNYGLVDHGMVRVFSGKDHALLYVFYGTIQSDRLGTSIDGAGDVNGDGYGDIIVGGFGGTGGSDKGKVYIYSGSNGAILHTFIGDSTGDRFGTSVSTAGDVNQDGYDDVIVGAPYDDNNGSDSGSARVFSGASGTILFTFNGDSAVDYFGWSVSGAGDVNKDGYADLIIGSPIDNNIGSARVISGATGSTLYTFNGDSTGDYFGISVAGAGDINNDSYPDLAVGAIYDDNNGSNSGSIRVFSGLDGSLIYTFDGDASGDQLGIVKAVGDINGDGFDDLAGKLAGNVRIYNGADGSILYTFSSNYESIDGAGDFNFDGYPDIVAGSMSNSGFVKVYSGALFLERTNDADLDGDVDTLDLDDDNDLVPDIWEWQHGLNQYSDDANDDPDGDDWINYQEYQNGTDPFDKDTDDDGIPDSVDYDPGDVLVPGYKPMYVVDGEDYGMVFNRKISNAGDVNADGHADIILADDNGAVLVMDIYNLESLLETSFELFGSFPRYSVAAAGDVNADGYADVLVTGSPYGRVISGIDGVVLHNPPGGSMDTAGDINLDGYADFITGDYSNASVYSGFDGSELYALGPGDPVAYAGDINSDGYGDLIIKVTNNTVRVISGQNGSILHTFLGDGQADQWGNSDGYGSVNAPAGDVNNDGYIDIMIAAPFDNLNGKLSGTVRVYSGIDGAVLYTIGGYAPQSYFGNSMAALGDVNQDGYDDFAIGSYAESIDKFVQGTVRVFSGKDGSVFYLFSGRFAGDYFGESLSAADINNDGFTDILVTAYNNRRNNGYDGRVEIYSGKLFVDQTEDFDGDGLVNTLDLDDDNDGVSDISDDFPYDNTESTDSDDDRIGNNEDLCPGFFSQDQSDDNDNGIGNVCEPLTFGLAKNNWMGSSVVWADVNEDGFDDIIVGSPLADVTSNGVVLKDAGMVSIISGADGGVIRNLYGTEAKARFGAAVAVNSNPNALPGPDLYISSPMADSVMWWGEVIRDVGIVETYSSQDGSPNSTDYIGEISGGQCGSSLAYDGELFIGCPKISVLYGGVLLKNVGAVVNQSSGDIVLTGTQPGEHLGSALAINTIDNHLLVGSPHYDVEIVSGGTLKKLADAGRVQVFERNNLGQPPLLTVQGVSKKDNLGAAIASFNQDINGDGNTDWSIGIPGADRLDIITAKWIKDVGAVQLYSGLSGVAALNIEGTLKQDRFGSALGANGDIDIDGINDLVVGSPMADKNSLQKNTGRVEVILGEFLF